MRHSLPADAQPLDVSAANSHISTLHPKVLGKRPMPVQRIIAAVLTRVQDPEPEGPPTSDTSSKQAAGLGRISWGWLPMLTLTSALGVLSVAHAYTSARFGATGVEIFFWLGILIIYVPTAVRLISPEATRFERISVLCVAGICFYLVKVINSPLTFSSIDAFLHWRTAGDIARSGHLFSENPLLPVSPYYPGLEIVTNAVSRLTGLSIFSSRIIVVGVAHLVTILSLFMFYEQVARSARIAGIAMTLYVGNPHFLFYDTDFAYGSLALAVATFALFAMARHEALNSDHRWIVLTACIALAAVTVTHHLTDFFLEGLLILWVVRCAFQRPARLRQSNLVKIALFGIFASLVWISLKGNPVVGYLSSYSKGALNELWHVLTGTSSARLLFVVYSGQPAPLWERIMAFSSVALILLSLPFGLLCLWQRYRLDALAYTLGIVSLFYPISHIFRLTNNGTEISDRSVAFLFIPICCVLAIFITQFWPTRSLNWKQTPLITCAISVVFLGGVILGAGPPWELLPGPYLVGAGEHSIEPEGVQASIWAGSYLGPNNRMATDLTNRILMSTYGDQRVVTQIEDNIDVTSVFFSSSVGPNEVSILRLARIRYLAVDLRLATALPSLGIYFEQGEPGSFNHITPIPLEALTKFNTIPQIDRLFDSGDIVIYDVGGLSNAPEKP